MEISSVLQSSQASTPSVQRSRLKEQSEKNEYYPVDNGGYLGGQTDKFYPSPGMRTSSNSAEIELFSGSRLSTAGSIDSVLK